jgi:hypothetical protein
MVGNRSLAMMRGFASTTTTTTTAVPAHGRFEVLSVPTWKRGHSSRGSVGERIGVIPGFKTSAGESHLVLHQYLSIYPRVTLDLRWIMCFLLS